MLDHNSGFAAFRGRLAVQALCLLACLLTGTAQAADVTVAVKATDANGAIVDNAAGFRWVLEEDTTHVIDPANLPANPFDTASLQLHKSYMPVVNAGTGSGAALPLTGLDPNKKYYVSILPDKPAGASCTIGDGCYTMSGAPIRFAAGDVPATTPTVTLTLQPLPPARAKVYVFEDIASLNNAPDAAERGLGGFSIFIYDAGGGQMMTDVFGNPLGTRYVAGTLDGDAAPTVARLGDGTIHSMTEAEVNNPSLNPRRLKVGEALIENIAPGKYGIQVVPPAGQGWKQTTTIEGTPGIDVWLRAGEPMFMVEFGPVGAHAFYGFVKEGYNTLPTSGFDGTPGTIEGDVVTARTARPPDATLSNGPPVPGCWVGLNELASGAAQYVARCDDNSHFSIPNVPPGTYQLVVWDDYLDTIISFFTVIVNPDGSVDGGGTLAVPRWFGQLEHYVFNDLNKNGIWEPGLGEKGIPDQVVNLRFRDGSIYGSSTTDTEGALPFDEIFPFFSWLVAEVDFARFAATGVTVTVDEGGPVSNSAAGEGKRNPQIQADGSEQRTETGPALTEGYNSFAGTNHRFDWGKRAYTATENGGITGVVYYQVTRAENDPRFAAPETWEPGIPRVQVNLYKADGNGVIQDTTGDGIIRLADVDNYPFGNFPGPEDEERDGAGGFGLGDAIASTYTDSWDDNIPDGCRNDTLVTEVVDPTGRCYDGIRNWSQVRPAVFDGGYAFGAPFTDDALEAGQYVVEANVPKGPDGAVTYKHQDELSKNVDFGDTFVPQALPPTCVGDPIHTSNNVPWNVVNATDELSLFPGVGVDPSVTGNRPQCSFKTVRVSNGKNAAADFFMYTDVPIAGHIQGNTTNDIGNTTDPASPNFGEKQSPAHIPISIRDYAGNEINLIYTDANGRYNGLVPSTYRINAPMPTGVSPNMVQVCLNPAGYEFHDPRFTQACYTLNFSPGQTTYLDTPVLPVSAFVGDHPWQLDCAYPAGTPIIKEASIGADAGTPGSGVGPYLASSSTGTLTLRSAGTLPVPNPDVPRPGIDNRDYGFGTTAGQVLLNGTPLTLVGSWDADVLQVAVPAGAGGQVEVVRANGMRTVHGITLVRSGALHSVASSSPQGAIQAAIDAAAPGDVVMVAPGYYYESLIVTKPIQLQGWGAFSTIINAGRNVNFPNLIAWQKRAHERANCPLTNSLDRIGLLPGQPNNVGPGTDPCGWEPGTGLLATEEGAGVLVAPMPGVFGSATARIDGFTFTSTDYAAGILVNGNTENLEISNNVVSNNLGQAAAGIRIGSASLLDGNNEVVDAQNINVRIHHNKVSQNGSTFEHGGGIGLFNGSDNYRVQNNYVCGNFTQGDGGGIAHYGRSPGGLIEGNRVLFNQSFDQTAQGRGGTGGGILIAGHEQAVGLAVPTSAGTGSVRVVGNLIQGNQAGAGDGGGIALRAVNGQDLLTSVDPTNWHQVDILNNMVVNNVAGLAGGGISLQDAVRVNIVNNTIANNDSSGTAAGAFTLADPNVAANQPAGIVSRTHSLDLQAIGGVTGVTIGDFSNPLIRNNIILGNRSMHWNTSSLVVDGFWDLGLIGTPGRLNAQYNVLSSESPGPTAGGPYNANNPRVPAASGEASVLASAYFNGDSVGTATWQTPLLAASATDEGGNFISVVHYPLTPTGDYHLSAGSSAIDTGTNSQLGLVAGLQKDFDGQARPVDGTTNAIISIVSDIGADEMVAVSNVEGPPQIVSSAPTSASKGRPYVYQVIAVDPQGTPISYGVTCTAGNTSQTSARCGTGGNAPQINANTGLLTWTPPSAPGNYTVTLTIRACSPVVTPCNQGVVAANRANQTVSLQLRPNDNATPNARPDSYDVTTQGTFSIAAPGVLDNDTPTNLQKSAELVTNVAAGGSVSLAPDGAFSYQPIPGYVGLLTFTYRAAGWNAAGAWYSPAVTVTLDRELAATNMAYQAAGGGEWRFAGNGRLDGRSLQFVRDRGNAVIGTATVTSGTWNATFTGGPDWVAGDTVTITASGAGQDAFQLQFVPVYPAQDAGIASSATSAYVQCPIDTDNDGAISDAEAAAGKAQGIVCKHLAAGDGYAVMADDTELYTFGFNDVTKTPVNESIAKGIMNAQFPGPTLAFDEGDKVYLTLTNVGMLLRPDLFDPHSVHFHGFPNAAAVFDGVPEASITINMNFSLTYYYETLDPGTYMYHCHVEAAEHMQMGMLGNLYVRPAQNGTDFGGRTQFVYNDGDGSTGYDLEFPIQIGSFDRNFHEQHIGVQPLPFAEMFDDYPLLNGRGYPDTVDPATDTFKVAGEKSALTDVVSHEETSQPMPTRIVIPSGKKALLRISNLNVTRFYTLATTGLPMQVVGTGAHILRGPGGTDLYYTTDSVTLGGGEAVDVLIDTNGVAAGTYLLYSTNLEALSNGPQDFGGMMTEIVVE